MSAVPGVGRAEGPHRLGSRCTSPSATEGLPRTALVLKRRLRAPASASSTARAARSWISQTPTPSPRSWPDPRRGREHGAIASKLDPAVSAGLRGSRRPARPGLRPASSDTGFGGVQPKSVMKVDLSPDEDAILGAFHQKWRYNVRLAAKKGVAVPRRHARARTSPPSSTCSRSPPSATASGVRSRSYYPGYV